MPRKKAPKQVHDDGSVSLNKYISDSGFCSRREADRYIEAGRVFINDETAVTGNRVYEKDIVLIDGEPLRKNVKTIYIVFNKPKGITSTTDPNDKTNIIGAIGHPQRIFPVGRLDKDSEGIIFLTNDGNIVNKILRAGNRHEKEYLVTVDPAPTPEFLKKLAAGVRLIPEGKTLPCKTAFVSKNTFRITLVQGLNRQIRRMCDALDHKVTHLKRIRVMDIKVGDLPVGRWRYMTTEEVAGIEKAISESRADEGASRVKRTVAKKVVAPAEEKPAPVAKKATAKGKAGVKEKAGAKEKPAAKTAAPPKSKRTYKDFRKEGKGR
jgi:23S rRNA pseudouridine2604 synthase